MNIATTRAARATGQRGFTLVELMVTVAIALFLLGGLLTIVQNVRQTYTNQQALVQLQDQQRFTMTVITDAIQAAGYFPDPRAFATATFPADGGHGFGAGWVFAGSHAAGVPDSLSTRFWTNLGYGPILCDGTDTSQIAGLNNYVIRFSVTPGNPGQLFCQVNNNAPVALVSGVQDLQVFYGVKHDNTLVDYNVDTYEQFDVLQGCGCADWGSISSVRVLVTFTNPLAGQPSQPPTITMERVIEVMARGGLHT